MSSPETAKTRARLSHAVKHVLEILALRNQGSAPLDHVCRAYFRDHANIGSSDRRTIRDITFETFRNIGSYLDVVKANEDLRSLSAEVWEVIVCLQVLKDEVTQATIFAEIFPNNPFVATFMSLLRAVKTTLPKNKLPKWLETMGLPKVAVDSLNISGRQTIRVNTLKTTPTKILDSLRNQGVDCQQSSEVSEAIHVAPAALTSLPGYAKGLYEIQDISSQLLCKLVRPVQADRGLDFCAGAGGKSLALSALKQNQGEIIASDIDRKRLSRGRDRAKRSGASNILFITQSELGGASEYMNFDWVLVDAPCSGSGTWHRNPDMRWYSSPEEIEIYQNTQREILTSASQRVRVGGALIYATCSLFAQENEVNIDWFLANNKNFRCVDVRELNLLSPKSLEFCDKFLRLYPIQHGRDGFFGAVLIRI